LYSGRLQGEVVIYKNTKSANMVFPSLCLGFLTCVFFPPGDGVLAHRPNPSVSRFVWVLSFDLSGKGGPTSSYATADIAIWIIAPRKPPYPLKDTFVKIIKDGSKLQRWMPGGDPLEYEENKELEM